MKRCRRDERALACACGELTADEARAFEEHCVSCASCRSAVEEYRRILEATRLDSVPMPPDGFFAQALRRARVAPVPVKRSGLRRWLWVLAPTAAGLAIVIAMRSMLSVPTFEMAHSLDMLRQSESVNALLLERYASDDLIAELEELENALPSDLDTRLDGLSADEENELIHRLSEANGSIL